MQIHPNTKRPPAQGGIAYQRIDFPAHVQQRLTERGSDRQSIQDRILAALNEQQDLRGAYALTAHAPVIIANFRPHRVSITTLLELGMSLKPGTRTVQA
jgi:hypothetical protein